jgi:hypothetical protein
MTASLQPSPRAKPQLLFFYEATDGRARRVEAYLAQVLQSRRNHDTVTVRRIDVRRHAALAERFSVAATPALVVVDAKRVQGRLEQPRGCAAIATLLQPWLR